MGWGGGGLSPPRGCSERLRSHGKGKGGGEKYTSGAGTHPPRRIRGHAGHPPTPSQGGDGDTPLWVGGDAGGTPGTPTRPADPPWRRGPAVVRGQLIPPPPPHLPVLKGPPPSALKGTAPLFPAWLAGCLPWDWGGGGDQPRPHAPSSLSPPPPSASRCPRDRRLGTHPGCCTHLALYLGGGTTPSETGRAHHRHGRGWAAAQLRQHRARSCTDPLPQIHRHPRVSGPVTHRVQALGIAPSPRRTVPLSAQLVFLGLGQISALARTARVPTREGGGWAALPAWFLHPRLRVGPSPAGQRGVPTARSAGAGRWASWFSVGSGNLG